MSNDPSPATPVNLATLYGALSRAIGRAGAVGKTAENTFHRYKYASAEGLIGEARTALAAEGLCVFPRHWRLKPHDTGEQRHGADGKALPPGYFADVEVVYIVAHTDGASMECEAITPVICEKGRPEDKALAGALTYSLGYFLRALLLLPRVDEENDVDQRDDRDYQPRQGQANGRDQRQKQADPPSANGQKGVSKLPDTQQKATAPAAPPFDAGTVILALSRATTEAEMEVIAKDAGPAPDALKETIKAVYKTRRDEIRAKAAPGGATADAAPPATDAEPAAIDQGFVSFLADVQRACGEVTEHWTEADAIEAWRANLHFSADRTQLDALCLPWLTAAQKRGGAVVARLRAAMTAEYKARRAELPTAAAGAAA